MINLERDTVSEGRRGAVRQASVDTRVEASETQPRQRI